jgi:ATP-dependent 26S proteasome regulatory subunit
MVEYISLYWNVLMIKWSNKRLLIKLLQQPPYILKRFVLVRCIDHLFIEKPLSRIPTNVGGLDHEMHIVRELIQVPLKQPQLYTQYGKTKERGV